MSYTLTMNGFGTFIRAQRERLSKDRKDFSVRKVAIKIGVEPAYLSKVEREIVSPPSEGKIIALAEVLGEDKDVLLAMAGKVSSDLLKVIKDRPVLFAELIRKLKSEPDHAVLRIVREVKDGEW
jgi:transcriptional regulator with XRE-family HTH domain